MSLKYPSKHCVIVLYFVHMLKPGNSSSRHISSMTSASLELKVNGPRTEREPILTPTDCGVIDKPNRPVLIIDGWLNCQSSSSQVYGRIEPHKGWFQTKSRTHFLKCLFIVFSRYSTSKTNSLLVFTETTIHVNQGLLHIYILGTMILR